MAQQTVGIGTSANDGTGDTLRTAGTKINDNFTELYARLGYSENVISSDVTMTTNGTWYDGGSVTLAAGTWFIIGQCQVTCSTNAIRTLQVRLHDGTSTLSTAAHVITGTGTAGQVGMMATYIAVLGTSTTVKCQATSSVNSETLRGTSTTATYIRAIRLA